MVKISFQDKYTLFQYPDQTIHIAHGLTWVIEQSYIYKQLNTFVIENVIQLIEEIIEADQKIIPIHDSVTMQDELFLQLLQQFFQGQQYIQRHDVEVVFNTFTDRQEYSDLAEIPNKNQLIVYFIFLREIMHHLNIDTIYYQAEE